MAILVRIKLPNRSEYRKVIRTKKDSFDLLGDNYGIDFNCAYLTTIWGGWIKIQCLDYQKGCHDPIRYFGKLEEAPHTKLTPKLVADVIKRLFEDIPHFQLIALILLIVAIAVGGIACYFAYDSGSKVQGLTDYVHYMYNHTMIPPKG
jgi:hypothetical protein